MKRTNGRHFRAATALMATTVLAGRTVASRAETTESTPKSAARAAASAAGDYATGPLMRGLRHWDHMPVRVYFAPEASSTKERVRGALAGISEWSVASRGVLWFTVVGKASDADVTVRFVEAAHVGAQDVRRVGETETEAEGRTMRRAHIRIAVGETTPEQITEDAAHEYGHALGIGGHSGDPHDLMYPSTTRYYLNGVLQARPVKSVSARDLNTIRRAYPDLFSLPNP